jgi:hypothetical protein
MKYVLLTAGQVCDVLGEPDRPLHFQTLNDWIRKGIVRPLVSRKGSGNHRLFGVIEVLAVAMLRGLHASGFSLRAAGNEAERILNLNQMDLDLAFSEGRTHLMILWHEVSASLVTRQTIVDASSINPPLAAALHLLPSGVDVKALFDRIVAAVELQAKEAEEAAAELVDATTC